MLIANYIVDPDFLKNHVSVPNGVWVRITNPKSNRLNGYLGQTGQEMAQAGAKFLVDKSLAYEWIYWNIAELVE
jgi:hypothetical protein